MQINRGLVFWGVALITAGVVALLIQAELIPTDAARQAWRLWPMVLIAIGLSVIASRTPFAAAAVLLAGIVAGGLAGSFVAGGPDGLSIGCGGEPTERATNDGTFGSSAEVRLDLDCGDMDVSTQAGTAWAVDARHGSDAVPQITSTESSLQVRAEGASFIGFSQGRQAWDVTLPTDISMRITIDANAASSRLDLSEADLARLAIDANAGSVTLDLSGADARDLVIDANAGSVSITTDASTRTEGSVEMNAGSLELCAPDEAFVAITLEDTNPSFSHNMDNARLDRDGDTWSTQGGEPDIRLRIDGNAASFTFNPEDGCR